jgi:hypothetical protein
MERAFLVVPTQAVVSQFIGTFKDFPRGSGRRASASTTLWRC